MYEVYTAVTTYSSIKTCQRSLHAKPSAAAPHESDSTTKEKPPPINTGMNILVYIRIYTYIYAYIYATHNIPKNCIRRRPWSRRHVGNTSGHIMFHTMFQGLCSRWYSRCASFSFALLAPPYLAGSVGVLPGFLSRSSSCFKLWSNPSVHYKLP